MDVIEAERGFKPDIQVRNQHDKLDQPRAQTAALVAIGAGTQAEVRGDAKVLSAVRAGRI